MSYNAANIGRNSRFPTEMRHKLKTVSEDNLLRLILIF
jgi:hypothetical protein